MGSDVVDRGAVEAMIDEGIPDIEAEMMDVGSESDGIDLEIGVDDLETSRERLGIPFDLLDVIPTVAIPACSLDTDSIPPRPAPNAPPALPFATTLLHPPFPAAIVPNSRGYKIASAENERDACVISAFVQRSASSLESSSKTTERRKENKAIS